MKSDNILIKIKHCITNCITSLQANDLTFESLPLLLDIWLIFLHLPKFPLNGFPHFVQSLSLPFELVNLILFLL